MILTGKTDTTYRENNRKMRNVRVLRCLFISMATVVAAAVVAAFVVLAITIGVSDTNPQNFLSSETKHGRQKSTYQLSDFLSHVSLK